MSFFLHLLLRLIKKKNNTHTQKTSGAKLKGLVLISSYSQILVLVCTYECGPGDDLGGPREENKENTIVALFELDVFT